MKTNKTLSYLILTILVQLCNLITTRRQEMYIRTLWTPQTSPKWAKECAKRWSECDQRTLYPYSWWFHLRLVESNLHSTLTKLERVFRLFFILSFLSKMYSACSKFETGIKNYNHDFGDNTKNIFCGQYVYNKL